MDEMAMTTPYILTIVVLLSVFFIFTQGDAYADKLPPQPIILDLPKAASTDPDYSKHTQNYIDGYNAGYDLRSPKKVELDYQSGWMDGQDDRMDGKKNKFEDGIKSKGSGDCGSSSSPNNQLRYTSPLRPFDPKNNSVDDLDRFPKPHPPIPIWENERPELNEDPDEQGKPGYVNKPKSPHPKHSIPTADPCTPPDSGDPLVFGDVSITRNWPEQHESFLTEFDLFSNGETVTLSRTLNNDTATLFMDWDEDGILSDGQEWLYHDTINVYEMLKILDSNSNGYFDYADKTWHYAKILQNDKVTPISETEILGFAWGDYETAYDDLYGAGTYCDWELGKDSCGHWRMTTYHEQGIVLQGGETIPSYGAVMGYLE